MPMNVGFIGFSSAKFDESRAKRIIKQVFDKIAKYNPKIVSGLTNVGIPGLVYAEADKRGLYTIGIACEKANEYECFDVEERVIVGKEWGDESQAFLDEINVLIKIGGGKQSKQEFKEFSGPKFSFDLKEIE